MKSKFTLNSFFLLVLFYPLLMFLVNIFGKTAFFLTSPYFFFIFLFAVVIILNKGKFRITENQKILFSLLLIASYNFTSIRFSLPIFFIIYLIVIDSLLKSFNYRRIDIPQIESIFFLYLVASIPFLFLPYGWDESERFVGFVGSPTVYAGIITTLFIITTKEWKIMSFQFIGMALIVLCLVYLSKTRLMLVFLFLYPFLNYLLSKKSYFTIKRLFVIFLITIMSIYPLYSLVVKTFPSLVTIRYENNRDASFGLRYFLYDFMKNDYLEGTFVEKALGKGNEYSRDYVFNVFKFDLMPHNDFIRLLNDWGLVGLVLFLLFLYKVATRNKTTFFVSIVYLLLFYSNMVFNLFLISVIIILYYEDNNYGLTNEANDNV